MTSTHIADAPSHPASAHVVELDVREDLRQGKEPFSRIMSAIGSLPDGDVLHLRAIFEPAPLFKVLGKQGFAHESIAHAPDDWSVWFWRPDAPAAPTQPPAPKEPGTDEFTDDDTTTHLDVRGLNPPEPMMRTLAALDTLPRGHTLVQVNSRVPQFLFPMLAERGFAYRMDDSRDDRVLVRIWHA